MTLRLQKKLAFVFSAFVFSAFVFSAFVFSALVFSALYFPALSSGAPLSSGAVFTKKHSDTLFTHSDHIYINIYILEPNSNNNTPLALHLLPFPAPPSFFLYQHSQQQQLPVNRLWPIIGVTPLPKRAMI